MMIRILILQKEGIVRDHCRLGVFLKKVLSVNKGTMKIRHYG